MAAMEGVHGTAERDRVPLASKAAYGAGGMVDIFVSWGPKTLSGPILTVLFGISPSVTGLIFFIFRMWDAILDPLMGWISDNTRTRWGRRKPYLLAGAVLTAVVFPLMWWVSPDWEMGAKVAWVTVSGLLLYLVFTVWAMPYQSMLLEMTPDYHERTRVSAWRAYFQKAATLALTWLWFLVQLPVFSCTADGAPDEVNGVRWVTGIMAVLILAVGVLPAVWVRERAYRVAARQARVSLKDNFRQTFACRPFLLLAGFIFLFAVGTNLAGGLGFFLKLYYVCGGDKLLATKIAGLEGSMAMASGVAGIPLFQWVARRFGKSAALAACIVTIIAATLLTWFTYNPVHPYWVMISGVLMAPGMTGLWVIIPSMNADVVDADELVTRERREGAFASIYSWIVKASFSLGIGLSGPVVELCGFRVAAGPAQPEAVLHAMRAGLAGLPLLLLVPALALLSRYRLSEARMREVRTELEVRRGTW